MKEKPQNAESWNTQAGENHPKFEREDFLFYSQEKGHIKSKALQKAIDAIQKYQEIRKNAKKQ